MCSSKYASRSARHLRWILTEAVHIHVVNEPGSQLTRFFLRVARKKSRQVATIATARKMLTAIYWMLMNQEEFKVKG